MSPVGDAIVLCRNNDELVWTAAMAACDAPAPSYTDGLSDDVVAAARLLRLTSAPRASSTDGPPFASAPVYQCVLHYYNNN